MLTVPAILLVQRPAAADEAAILADLRAFFSAGSAGQRAQLAARIESDPAYDRTRVSEWLHAAGLFPPQRAGRLTLTARLAGGSERPVVVRVPEGYDGTRPYPLIYALHGQGGHADSILQYVQELLGERVDEFVLAAPDGYQEVVIHHTYWPPLYEHPAVLRTLREALHIDNDRIHLVGYSRGGHAAWTVAVLYTDQFASMTSIAGTFLLEQVDRLWDVFLPNLRHLPVLAVWGRKDTLDDAGQPSPQGGIAGLNAKLVTLARDLHVPVTAFAYPEKGHGGLTPQADDLRRALAARRVQYPASFAHTFRHIGQGPAYWIEPHVWTGPIWADRPPSVTLRDGEDPFDAEQVRNAAVRAYREALGEIRGEITDQQVRVYRKKIRELTVWFGDGMVDWDKPIQLVLNGRADFAGLLRPDLLLCLTQAARTRDFDRLRWAGLRVRSGRKTTRITAATEFPSGDPARQQADRP